MPLPYYFCLRALRPTRVYYRFVNNSSSFRLSLSNGAPIKALGLSAEVGMEKQLS